MIDDPRQGAFPWRTVPVRAYERQRFGKLEQVSAHFRSPPRR
jgi:hypothetical protein